MFQSRQLEVSAVGKCDTGIWWRKGAIVDPWLATLRAELRGLPNGKKGVAFVRSLRYSLFCAEATHEPSELRPHPPGPREVPH
jgi:hypothetical protein